MVKCSAEKGKDFERVKEDLRVRKGLSDVCT